MSNDKLDKDKKAFELYTLASNQGFSDAQHNLAVCYEKGFGCQKDEKKAFELFILASDQGHACAQYNLALCYEIGIGCEKDLISALKYYTLCKSKRRDELNIPNELILGIYEEYKEQKNKIEELKNKIEEMELRPPLQDPTEYKKLKQDFDKKSRQRRNSF